MKPQNESARLLLGAFPPSCPFELVQHKQTNTPERRRGSSRASGDARRQELQENRVVSSGRRVLLQRDGGDVALGALQVGPLTCSISLGSRMLQLG